jgi:hypothetical protein
VLRGASGINIAEEFVDSFLVYDTIYRNILQKISNDKNTARATVRADNRRKKE